MPDSPDLAGCWFQLAADERDALLGLCEDLGVEPEHHPDLVRLVRDVALKRLADATPGPRGDAWETAALRLGLDPAAGATARRRLDYLRHRSGEIRRDSEADAREVGSGT